MKTKIKDHRTNYWVEVRMDRQWHRTGWGSKPGEMNLAQGLIALRKARTCAVELAKDKKKPTHFRLVGRVSYTEVVE